MKIHQNCLFLQLKLMKAVPGPFKKMAAREQNETHRNLVDPDAGLETKDDYKQVMNEESEGKSTLTHMP